MNPAERNKPDHEELKRLAGSEEFQRILNSDPELARLEELKYDRRQDFVLLAEVLGIPRNAGGAKVRGITPALWSLLWSFGNPYVTGGEPTLSDADLFLFLLHCGSRGIPLNVDAPSELARTSKGFCRKSGFSFEDAHARIREMIHTAFQPLSMLPHCGGDSGEPARFDADWVARITGIAARASNERADYCMHDMSLSAVCCHYINHLREKQSDSHRIRRHASDELAKKIMERTWELARDFLKKKEKSS